jgi:hypothetical protein
MQAIIVHSLNPLNPLHDRQVQHLNEPRTLHDLAPKTELPYLTIVNGLYYLPHEHDYEIKDGDLVAYVSLVQGGGGGSNPLRIIATIALSVAAPHLAVGILGTAAGTVGALTTIGSIATGVIGLVGSAVINAALGPRNEPPSLRQQNALAASPTYNLQAQGNRARLGQAIPDCYGRMLHYPDFSADPYAEYAGNEQYLYQQFCLGQGEFEIEQIRIGDTDISNFTEIETEIVPPFSRGSLFPSLVETASEVTGQEAFFNAPVGPFPACSAGQTITAIAVDVVLPKGLFFANDDGGLNGFSVSFRVEAREIDDAGDAVGAGTWTQLGAHGISRATATPIRLSYRYEVSEARYEVRFTRTSAKNTTTRYGNDLVWGALRGYEKPVNDYGNVTILNVRARATNNLSAQSSRDFNIIKTRKLPIYNGTSWSAPTATRNPAWALANVLRAEYNGNLPDDRIDLVSLLAFANTCTSRGDNFDAIFDNQQVMFEMANIVARTGRAKIFQQGGVYYTWRDQWQEMPTGHFNMRNIKRGSLKTNFLLPDVNTADAIEVTYRDEGTWSDKTVLCKLPSSDALTPVKVNLFGVTNKAQAWREGMHMAAQNRYRRQFVNFTTEMEGYIPSYGDLITLSHDRAAWGQSGDLTDYDSGTRIIQTTEPLIWVDGENHYFRFRKPNGAFDGPYLATEGVDEFHAVLDDVLTFAPNLDSTAEKTSYSFGVGNSFGKLAIVIGVKPRGLYEVEILTVNEDEAVHEADTGIVPVGSSQWNLPAVIRRPQVADLNVSLGGTAATPLLQAAWQPAAGAYSYLVDISYDGGSSWTRAAEPTTSECSFPVRRGDIRLRVAGMGLARGDYIEYIGNPFFAPPPDVATLLVSSQTDGTRQLDWTLPGQKPPDLDGYKIRSRLGTNVAWGWADLNPMHDGVLTASPWETNLLAAGQYTFAIKAIDDSGIESENAVFVIADLGDPRLAGVIFNVLPHTQGWTGTKTDCHVEGLFLVANSTDTWADKTTWSSFNRWVQTPATSISYEHSIIDLGGPVLFIPFVEVIADGTVTVEESHSTNGVDYTSFAAAGLQINARYIKIKVTVTGATVPLIRSMNIKLSGETIEEQINDLDTSTLTGSYRLGVGDIRLPIANTYTQITQIQVTLQNVGAGYSWVLIDKDITVGPRIKIYNASNALADATIDALIKGA